MNYVSYPEIYPPQEQSLVSQDSLKSTDYIHSLKTTGHSLQSTKTTQSMDSLKTTPEADQTAQEEHRAATKAKKSTAHEPKSTQVSEQEFNNYKWQDPPFAYHRGIHIT